MINKKGVRKTVQTRAGYFRENAENGNGMQSVKMLNFFLTVPKDETFLCFLTGVVIWHFC